MRRGCYRVDQMTDVLVENQDGICTLTLDRVNKKNALTPSMYSALAAGIKTAQADNACRVVAIAAAGEDFTAGNDLAAFAAFDDESLAATVSFMRELMQCKLPVVAAVKGNVVGIGTTLLLHCDVVVSADDAKFVTPFINLGLVPEYASSYLLPKAAGYLNAVKWLMLGEPVDANTALVHGLVTDVVDRDGLSEQFLKRCQQLASKPREALLQTKALLRRDSDTVSEVIEKELVVFSKALQSDPAQEAFTAFIQKRPINKARFLG